MYKLNTLATWLKDQIKEEQDVSYSAIYFIIAGLTVGLLVGFLTQDVSFTSVITKIGGLGISITTIVGVFYYLYKYDEIETRKSDFLIHINQEIKKQEASEKKEDKGLYEAKIEPVVFHDIIVDILKNKLAETASSPKQKEDGKKDS